MGAMAELPRSPRPSGSRGLRLAILLLALSTFGCDHATKLAAQSRLAQGGSIDLVSGLLELRFAPNPDTAFSLLRTFGIRPPASLLLTLSAFALLGVIA